MRTGLTTCSTASTSGAVEPRRCAEHDKTMARSRGRNDSTRGSTGLANSPSTLRSSRVQEFREIGLAISGGDRPTQRALNSGY